MDGQKVSLVGGKDYAIDMVTNVLNTTLPS